VRKDLFSLLTGVCKLLDFLLGSLLDSQRSNRQSTHSRINRVLRAARSGVREVTPSWLAQTYHWFIIFATDFIDIILLTAYHLFPQDLRFGS
jgi:hypothetical protein